MEYINREKIENIKLTKENMYVLLDFDRTITSYESLDSWSIASMAADKGCQTEVDKLYDKYRPIEMEYNIPYEEKYKKMEEWYNSCMNLYYKYHLNKHKLKEAVKNGSLIFRKGAEEFLEYTYENHIPVIILSAGIGSVIKEFLKENNCFFDNIFLISNTFIYNENRDAYKLENYLIHTMNKTVEGHLRGERREKFDKRPYKLLFGDTIEDINMTPKKDLDKTIKVGFLDEELENLSAYKENFDIVLTKEDATFDKARKIVKI